MTRESGSAFLRRVNEGISSAAERLSRTFNEQVSGPEEGLLLPVHNGEREKAMTSRVFVS